MSSRNSDVIHGDSDSGSVASSRDERQIQEDKRWSMNATGKAKRQGRPARNKLERVATAGAYPSNRRMLNPQVSTHNGRQLLRNDTDAFTQGGMKKSDSKLDILYERLKNCHGEDGMVDPAKILETMNMVQVEEDPDAYVPGIEKQH